MSTDKEWQDFFTMVDQDIQRLGMTATEATEATEAWNAGKEKLKTENEAIEPKKGS